MDRKKYLASSIILFLALLVSGVIARLYETLSVFIYITIYLSLVIFCRNFVSERIKYIGGRNGTHLSFTILITTLLIIGYYVVGYSYTSVYGETALMNSPFLGIYTAILYVIFMGSWAGSFWFVIIGPLIILILLFIPLFLLTRLIYMFFIPSEQSVLRGQEFWLR